MTASSSSGNSAPNDSSSTPDSAHRPTTSISSFAPVHVLPPELLADIFDLTVPPSWYPHYAGRVVLSFTQVCSNWRAVAHSCMSHLWADISVHIEHSPKEWGQVVAAYLERSSASSRHLSITLDFTIDCNPFAESDVWPNIEWDSEAWALLCAQSLRWAKVKLDAIPREAYSGQRLSCPILTQLFLGLLEEDPIGPIAPESVADVPTAFFADAPALEALTVSLEHKPTSFDIPKPWNLARLSILDRLTTPSGTFGACASAVRASSRTLTHLAIDVMSFGEWIGPPATLPALQTLYLARGAIAVAPRHLVAPAVHTLTLCAGWGCIHPQEQAALELLVRRSDGMQNLRTMYLRGMAANGLSIHPCLALFPTVTSLALDFHTQTAQNEHIRIVGRFMYRERDPRDPKRFGQQFKTMPELRSLSIVFGEQWRRNMLIGRLVRNMLEKRAVDPEGSRTLKTFDSDMVPDGEHVLGEWPVPRLFEEPRGMEFPVP
ncbi:uncharacterized protein SCHCODRAFT_02615297 [Schizophyllum commune H4-8]|nr:uncharacterized protein SCHCODRAFT_02615297 [Schizophyllum commune H4-8]KAI5896596.1 hypothetical protein SCHCODRAFT_02615297 [Schizophyllum commune H4-8]